MKDRPITETESSASSRTVRILVAEDNEPDYVLMMSAIRRHGYAVSHRRVDTPEEFRQALLDDEYDVVLSDHNLCNWTGSDALEIVRLTGKDVPVLIVTGFLGDERAVEYLKQGAADYVIKDNLGRLPLALSRALNERARRLETLSLQKQIQQAKEDWERTFDSIPDPIMLLDREGRIVRVNRGTSSMFQLDAREVAGLPYSAVTHRDGAPPRDYPVRRMLATGQTESADVEDRRMGKIFHVMAIPLKDDVGRIDGVILEMADVTERKRAENAKIVMLREVNQRVKNSFGVISALLELQARHNAAEPVREALKTCELRIQCASLIHEHIYRSDSPDHIDFDVFATHLGRQLFSLLDVDQSKITLDVQYSSLDVPVLLVGAVGLALNELIINSIRHGFADRDKGSVRILFEEIQPGLRRMVVSDDGAGIMNSEPEPARERLGLQIVSALAQELKGSVSIEGEHGTTVAMTFPIPSMSATVRH